MSEKEAEQVRHAVHADAVNEALKTLGMNQAKTSNVEITTETVRVNGEQHFIVEATTLAEPNLADTLKTAEQAGREYARAIRAAERAGYLEAERPTHPGDTR